MSEERVQRIRAAIETSLQPVYVEIRDDSASHAGHAGARSGGGHFYATIVADLFEGKNLVQRHQLVYRALGSLMQSDIHALGILAYTPLEYQQKETTE
jgi:BolA protein